MLYAIGMGINIVVIIFQIKAAQDVMVTTKVLPLIWYAFATSCFFFALDSIPNWHYVVFFGINAVVMATAARIVWKKAL